MHIDQAEIALRKAWLVFTEQDEKHLLELNKKAAEYADDVISSLYDHFLKFPETRKFFEKSSVLEHVKNMQYQYFLRLTQGNYDENYIENRLKIGAVHAQVGLDVKWYLGGYSYYLRDVAYRIFEAYPDDFNKALEIFFSLKKLVYLDIGLAIDTYIYQREQTIKKQQMAMQEKEALLKEVYHRVKNNLQVVSSLLNLQVDSVEDVSIQQILLESANRVKAMALIHEMLYQSENLAKVDMAAYINNLVNYFNKVYVIDAEQITITLDLEPITLNIDAAIPCGLILNELISNALKHAFPKNQVGIITVSFQKKHDKVELMVQDNGIGLPQTFDFQKTNTLGLQLIHNLTKQLNGKINLMNEGGACFKLIF